MTYDSWKCTDPNDQWLGEEPMDDEEKGMTMSAIKYTIHFTALDGSEATITGASEALSAIEGAFERAGIQFNEQVECWDEGFYSNIRPKFKITRSSSVECPHCHWGFAPHVIEQHIREKH